MQFAGLTRTAGIGAVALALLTGCARDREAAIHDRLSLWFVLGDTLFFESRARCTAAVYRLPFAQPKSALPVAGSVARAKAALARRHTPANLDSAALLAEFKALG